jgi:predicted dienelactone hydrolase
MRGIRFLLTLVVIALLVGAAVPLQAQGKGPNLVGLRPDAPEYGKHGPFWVGYKQLVIGEGTAHPLDAEIWYPALNPNGVKEEITYQIKFKVPGFLDSGEIYGHALLNASVDTSKSPYPLVVFSHGFGSNATWYSTLIEHYASYGFVVIAPNHIEQMDAEADLWKASIDRPRDIKQTLDYSEKLTASGGNMAGLIDMKHVAVVGHSYGGYTALAMAGAQYDLDAYNARCAALPKDDPKQALCTPLVPKEANMAARAGVKPMPKGLWPAVGDPRVMAIISMAGDSYMFDKAGLAEIAIPMMAMGGTIDVDTPYEWGVKPTYEDVSSTQKALVTIENASHTIFMPTCNNIPWSTKLGDYYGWLCLEKVWDKERGLDVINHFSTAFLLDTLKGDKNAHKALLPDAVKFVGIDYKTMLK